MGCGLCRTAIIGPTLPRGLKRISKVHASVFNRSAILWQAASLARTGSPKAIRDDREFL
jgi:hypothetical protein